jgi:thiol:disulfide interchange protein
MGLVGLFWGGTPHFFDQFATMYLGFLMLAILLPAFLLSVFLPKHTALPLWVVFLLTCAFAVAKTLQYCSPMHCGENTWWGAHNFWLVLWRETKFPFMESVIPALLFQIAWFLKNPRLVDDARK